MSLKVLHVGNIRDMPESGVANVVPNYLKYQSELIDVSLLNVDSYIPKNAIDSYEVFRFNGLRNLKSSTVGSLANPDLVVFHEVYWPQFIGIARHYKRKGIPYIIIPHVSLTDTAQDNKRVKKILGNILLFNAFIKGAAAIQYLSQSEKEQTSRFRSVPSFIRGNGIEIKGRKKYDFRNSAIRFIYIGRLEYTIKGIDRLLAAANIVKSELLSSGSKIEIYGPAVGDNITRIEKDMLQYDLYDVVSVSTGLFGKDKDRAILNGDCFIQLSRTEGQPLAIMEAMDMGMPCIVTEGTTFYDAANEMGVAISVDDEIDTARVLKSILTNQSEYDLSKISIAASKYAKSNFDWTVVSKLMIDDYIKITKAGV